MRIIAKTVNITMYPEKMLRLDDEDKEPESEVRIDSRELSQAMRGIAQEAFESKELSASSQG